MRAVAFTRPLPIEAPDSLVELDLPRPEPGPRDLLVNVRAVSVNPVDTKIRGARHQGSAPDVAGKPRVLGWDAAGVVVGKGAATSGFAVGDEVYYAGELDRPGSNAEYQAVDERLVGRKPKSIGFAEAAALPLTSITAWELLFDRFEVREGQSGASLLVSGAAGGVGSILVQLARRLTGLDRDCDCVASGDNSMGDGDGRSLRDRSHQTASRAGEGPEATSGEICRELDRDCAELCTTRRGPGSGGKDRRDRRPGVA